MAAPTLTITMIAGTDVSGGEDADITPSTATPWMVEGTVRHDLNKPVTAMWYYINGVFRIIIPHPPEAGQPNHTDPVDWLHFLTSSDFPPGSFSPYPTNGDYELKVYVLNEDGPAEQIRMIHVKNFTSQPDPGPGPGPSPPPPVLPPRPVI